MVVRTGLRARQREFCRMLGEMIKRCSHFDQQFVRHGLGEPVPDEDALNHQIFAIRRHGVGRNQPSALAQAIGKIVERKAGGHRVFELPTEPRYTALAIVNNFEDVELSDLVGQVAPQLTTPALDCTITALAQAEEVVVLANYFPAGREKLSAKVGILPPR
jgi:hypothetical protein